MADTTNLQEVQHWTKKPNFDQKKGHITRVSKRRIIKVKTNNKSGEMSNYFQDVLIDGGGTYTNLGKEFVVIDEKHGIVGDPN